MCGIVGYVGSKPALPIVIPGMLRLKHRGYDSAGLAIVLKNGTVAVRKIKGDPEQLKQLLADQPIPTGQEAIPHVGLAHNRWATHGEPSVLNAHPHQGSKGIVTGVHNGIIGNFEALKKQFNITTVSDTDTEVFFCLIEQFVLKGNDLVTAVQLTHGLVSGEYSIAVVSSREPDKIVAANNGGSLVLGILDHGYLLASDPTAVVEHTQHIVRFTDGQMVEVTAEKYRTLTMDNQELQPEIERLELGLEQLSKGGFAHHMESEIYEQPSSLERTMAGRIRGNGELFVHLGGLLDLEPFVRDQMNRVVLTACGTSWHAALIGKLVLERMLQLPVQVEYASEFTTPVDKHTLVIVLSQSGETYDTKIAVQRAQKMGAKVWAICNVVGSTIASLADAGVYLRVGVEIGVASTKAFTAQVVDLVMTALALSRIRKSPNVLVLHRQRILQALLDLPDQARQVLELAPTIREIAQAITGYEHALFLGRGFNFPSALEGALKLKEISYPHKPDSKEKGVHAEGYPAGEMKHGPIALIDPEIPVIFIAVPEDHIIPADGNIQDDVLGCVYSNLEEVASRKGLVILVACEGDEIAQAKLKQGKVKHLISIPPTIGVCTTVLSSIILQLLAYYIAAEKGCRIDNPRNLAKSVTVG
ncbi:MAG: glutamine--fructose-6-phosphate transaminase (isomerizing) [bacterium]